MEKIKTLYRNDHEEHSSQGQPQTFPAMATTNFPQSDTLQVTPTNHSESVALPAIFVKNKVKTRFIMNLCWSP
jgi:hypothetical protein